MQLDEKMITKNACYKQQRYMKPVGIVVHSTACNQTNPYVFYNSWNNPNTPKAVHAFIGIKPGTNQAITVQNLPWTMKCWGCASGRNGSWNDTRIQFEICEDNTNNKEYLNLLYVEAVELCAILCYKFSIQTCDIQCHQEGYKLGYASNHSDVFHWWDKHGFTMDQFRKDVRVKVVALQQKKITIDDLMKRVNILGKANINGSGSNTSTTNKTTTTTSSIKVGSKVKVKAGAKDLNTNREYSSFVYKETYTVISITGERVVFGENKNSIIGATSIKNLTLV